MESSIVANVRSWGYCKIYCKSGCTTAVVQPLLQDVFQQVWCNSCCKIYCKSFCTKAVVTIERHGKTRRLQFTSKKKYFNENLCTDENLCIDEKLCMYENLCISARIKWKLLKTTATIADYDTMQCQVIVYDASMRCFRGYIMPCWTSFRGLIKARAALVAPDPMLANNDRSRS